MSKKKHDIHIMEAGTYTVTSGGHWFNATGKTVDKFVPGLLKKHDFEKLVSRAVLWIDSTGSLAMILYFLLVFTAGTLIASVAAILFHVWWYFNKSAFVNITMSPVLNIVNKDFFQLLLAGVCLSFLGIGSNYSGLIIGIIYFFLFKVDLLRMFLERVVAGKISKSKLPLNDRVLKMVLVRYALYEDLPPPEVQEMDKHIQETLTKSRFRRKK